MAEGFEYTIDSSRRRVIDFKELWQYRELFYFFAWRDIKVKYKQTVLGVLWVMLQPLLTILIFSFSFGRIVSANLPVAYPVFVFSGLLFWTLFSGGVSAASNSMLTNAAIVKKIYFPRLIIPVSAVLVCCIDLCISFIAFVAFLFYYQVEVSFVKIILFWPLAMLLTIIATIGLSTALAALIVKYRDFRYIIPFGLQLALFVSPVIYPLSIFGNQQWLDILLALNPMHGAITLFRFPIDGMSIDWLQVSVSGSMAIIFFIAGIGYFNRTEAYLADIA